MPDRNLYKSGNATGSLASIQRYCKNPKMLHKRPAPPDALARLKLASEPYDPPCAVPVLTDPPPAPPGEGLRIEKPEWRSEEERSRRQDAEIGAKQTAAEKAAELDPPPEPRPAKPAKKTSTPNLDRVRAWRKGEP